MSRTGSNAAEGHDGIASAPGPLWLLAELTYACPLQCPYCSNPINFADSRAEELSTAEWLSVLEQGRQLGAVQLGLSGGEPCVRQDLEEIVSAAHKLGYYTNLITSTLGLSTKRIRSLRAAGLDHVQVSYQGADARTNDFFAGTNCFETKMRMTRLLAEAGFPMVHNFVLHRHNIHQVESMLEMARAAGAQSVELANCQYHGWALRNHAALLPTGEQLQDAEQVVARFRALHGTRMEIFFVVPDWYESRPRPCVNGWGSTLLSVTPDGRILPCQGAQDFPTVEVPNVRRNSLDDIWYRSRLFNLFRGDGWMQEPCRSCPEKGRDFGGCRCQAYQLTGDPARTDPVCSKAPDHAAVVRLRHVSPSQELEMRTPGRRWLRRIDVLPA